MRVPQCAAFCPALRPRWLWWLILDLETLEITGAALSRLWRIDPRTLLNLTKRGVLQRNKRGSFVLGPTSRAYQDYLRGQSDRDPEEALDYNRERARLTFEQANRAHLRYQTEAGKLVPAASAQLALECVLVPVRQYFQEQADRLAPGLAGLAVHEIKAAIDKENRRELSRLANPVLEFAGTPEDPELDLLVEDPNGGEPPTRAGDPAGAEDAGAAED